MSGDLLKEYEEFPKLLKDQLEVLLPKFENDPRIAESAKEIKKRGITDSKVATKMAIFYGIETIELLQKRFLPEVFAFDLEGRSIKLEKIMTKGKIKRVCLIRGTLHNPIDNNDPSPVIVKWYQSGKKDTTFEVSAYRRLRSMGAVIPWFSSSFWIFNSPVLVLKPLESVGPEDNEFEMAAQILENLIIVHQICIHSDIKPPNIMKEEIAIEDIEDKSILSQIRKTQPPGKNGKVYRYLLIDYGGISTEKLKYGYRRAVWSPKWTSQKAHVPNQVTTPVNDFIELGYTMKTIQNMRTGEKAIRHGFTGKLAKYMKAVEKINKKDVKEKDYLYLIELLRS